MQLTAKGGTTRSRLQLEQLHRAAGPTTWTAQRHFLEIRRSG